MGNTQKYMLKAASFYFIVWNEILIVPSLYFSIDILFCNSDNHDSSDIRNHNGTNIECWSSVYIILLIIAVIQLLLIFLFISAMYLFMNDSFTGSKIPWS